MRDRSTDLIRGGPLLVSKQVLDVQYMLSVKKFKCDAHAIAMCAIKWGSGEVGKCDAHANKCDAHANMCDADVDHAAPYRGCMSDSRARSSAMRMRTSAMRMRTSATRMYL